MSDIQFPDITHLGFSVYVIRDYLTITGFLQI
jgi:hypothetical protein